MILLNFSHPLTSEQLNQLTAMAGRSSVSWTSPLPLTTAGLTPEEWRTLPLMINPPALTWIAVNLFEELHGRIGYSSLFRASSLASLPICNFEENPCPA